MEVIPIRDERLCSWAPLKPTTTISANEVHIWCAHLDAGPACLEQLQGYISLDEQIRSQTFRSGQDRRRFLAARGILRDILARYANRAPAELEFANGPQGKPFLDLDSGLRFNLSHSHELALYAVALGREVGIDVERVELHLAGDEIAERLFSPQDLSRLRAVPPAQRTRAFFEFWTRREAYLKARGEGFASNDLSPSAGKPEWSVHSLEAESGYAAALVVQGAEWQPRLYKWQPQSS